VSESILCKYIGREHAQHLLDTINMLHSTTEDWSGSEFLKLHIDWDHVAGACDISMPGYIERALECFHHPAPTRRQYSPHAWQRPVYGSTTQAPMSPDTTDPLDDEGVKRLQEVIGTLLFYGRAVDYTVLQTLSDLASEQANGTAATMGALVGLLNYVATLVPQQNDDEKKEKDHNMRALFCALD